MGGYGRPRELLRSMSSGASGSGVDPVTPSAQLPTGPCSQGPRWFTPRLHAQVLLAPAMLCRHLVHAGFGGGLTPAGWQWFSGRQIVAQHHVPLRPGSRTVELLPRRWLFLHLESRKGLQSGRSFRVLMVQDSSVRVKFDCNYAWFWSSEWPRGDTPRPRSEKPQ